MMCLNEHLLFASVINIDSYKYQCYQDADTRGSYQCYLQALRQYCILQLDPRSIYRCFITYMPKI